MGAAQSTLTSGQLVGVSWRVSSRTANTGGNCVECGVVGDTTGRVAVRHSHHPDAYAFVYARTEWEAFLAGAKRGTYDFPAQERAWEFRREVPKGLPDMLSGQRS